MLPVIVSVTILATVNVERPNVPPLPFNVIAVASANAAVVTTVFAVAEIVAVVAAANVAAVIVAAAALFKVTVVAVASTTLGVVVSAPLRLTVKALVPATAVFVVTPVAPIKFKVVRPFASKSPTATPVMLIVFNVEPIIPAAPELSAILWLPVDDVDTASNLLAAAAVGVVSSPITMAPDVDTADISPLPPTIVTVPLPVATAPSVVVAETVNARAP